MADCSDHDIAVTAYSPLSGCDLEDPVLIAIAERHSGTPATIALRWLAQRGIAVIPKSSKAARIASNLEDAAVESFVLTDAEMELLYGLDEGGGAWQEIH